MLKFLTNPTNLNFIRQKYAKKFITIFQKYCFQQFLTVFIIERKIDSYLIHQSPYVVNLQNLSGEFFADLAAFHTIRLKQFFDGTHHRFLCITVPRDFFTFKSSYFRFQIFRFMYKTQKFSAFQPFHQNAKDISGHLHDLFYKCNRSDLIQILLFGILDIRIFLCDKKNFLITDHCSFNCFDGFFSAYIKMYNGLRKNDRSPKCH